MTDNREVPKKPRTFEMKRYIPNTCIEKYSYMLIRPPRFQYNQELLNPRRKYKNRYEHTVYCIPFPLSVYTPTTHTKYVILYLHGNSSSRYEGYSQLPHIPADVGLACFDFGGCGNRLEEDYISLGKKEAKEVDLAVKFLRSKNYKVAVWGRSMGAVSALLSEESQLLIVDSPFSNLKAVCKEISQKVVPCACMCFFHCLFPCLFMAVSSDVEAKTGIHPDQLDILEQINKNTNRRIMFLAAKGDKMVSYTHAQALFQQFKGTHKKLMLFQGTHHSDRSVDVLFEVFAFIEASLFPDSLLGQSKRSDLQNKIIESEADVRSFTLLKDEKLQKQSKQSLQMKSMNQQQRTSIKIQISSRFVQGGQTQKMGVNTDSNNGDPEHL